MSVIFTPCVDCKHLHDVPYKAGGTLFCDAFVNGIPKDFLFKVDEKEKECNNGIKFEPIDE